MLVRLTDDELYAGTVLHVTVGSVASGLSFSENKDNVKVMESTQTVPNDLHSDVDRKAIVVPPDRHLFALKDVWETQRGNTFSSGVEYDTEYMSLKKAMYLLSKGNPNVLEMFASTPQNTVYINTAMYKVVNRLSLFMSKQTLRAYKGIVMNILDEYVKLSAQTNAGTPEIEAKRNKLLANGLRYWFTAYRLTTDMQLVVKHDEHLNYMRSVKAGKDDNDAVFAQLQENVVVLDKLTESSHLADIVDAGRAQDLYTTLIKSFLV